jgi:hypothetical protein
VFEDECRRVSRRIDSAKRWLAIGEDEGIMGGFGERPSMLDRMSAQYCLDKAAECDRKALDARDPDAAKTFELIAGRWRLAAANRDFTNKVEDILRSLRTDVGDSRTSDSL